MANDIPVIPDKPTGPFPKLTKSTENPRSQADYSGKDEPLTRTVQPYIYVDMRNQRWFAFWLGQGWIARPTPEAAKFYGLSEGNTFAGADDARGLIDMVEANIERDRLNAASSGGFPWWLVLLGAAAYYHSKKKRRR